MNDVAKSERKEVAVLPRTKGSVAKKPQNKKVKVDALTCTMCGKTQKPTMHYQSFNPIHSTGYLPYCKSCLKNMCHDDKGNINIEKVKEMLKLIDRPFMYEIFKISFDDPMDTIGTYMKNIAMPQYRNLGWTDSIFEPQLNDRNNIFNNAPDINVTDDIIELFGAGYTNEEYQAMWRKYNFLKNNYPDVTNLHVEALVSYVRYKVKEEFAIANNNAGEAEKWAKLSQSAATAAKINPSQLSKADLQGGLNSFGELIKAVEQAVDIIPILPQFKFRPNDALDFVIWCYVNYVRDLKGLPVCQYKEIYQFYDKRKQEYIEQYGDPYGIFKDDPTMLNRDSIEKFIFTPSNEDMLLTLEGDEDA